ncbi:MAG TPA: hypothetical protein ENK49_09355 [Gammaproteobacteria bacterium]|nr:hypothetical protein [Gammaproteobacteria bacterium]
MKRSVRFLLLLLCAAVSPSGHAMQCPLLVVANRSAPVNSLSQKTIRRLYLGVPYQTRNGPLQPVRNASDAMLQEVFLQKILFMSKNAYRRVLANRLVQRREAGPAEYRDVSQLIEGLSANPLMISYLWASDLPPDGQLKILLDVPCEND